MSAPNRAMEGTIAEFSPSRGFGYIVSNIDERFYFQAIEIRDGSRTVELGQRVIFFLRAGSYGTWEASNIFKI